MLREAEAPSSSGVGPAPSSLEELQAYLQQYPPSYYTKNGKEPLVYPYVLLLSLQVTSASLHNCMSSQAGNRLDLCTSPGASFAPAGVAMYACLASARHSAPLNARTMSKDGSLSVHLFTFRSFQEEGPFIALQRASRCCLSECPGPPGVAFA